jgi:hypothetical protein
MRETMTIPTLIFAFLLASLLGALYHLIRDGGLGRLFLDLFLSWAGFALGYFLGVRLGWSLYPVGGLDLGLSIPLSLILLVGVDWIGRIRIFRDTFPGDENRV